MSDLVIPNTFTSNTTISSSEVNTNFSQIATIVNDLDNTNLSGSAGITDANLASPTNVTYKTISQAAGFLNEVVAGAETRYIGLSAISNAGAGAGVMPRHANFSNEIAVPLIYFDNDDYTVTSKTQKLRVRAQILVNDTAPGITLTVGLHSIESCGGAADGIQLSTTTAVTGSTVAFATPAATSRNQGNSGDFTIPSDGYYALAVVTSAAFAANSFTHISAQLQTRNV